MSNSENNMTDMVATSDMSGNAESQMSATNLVVGLIVTNIICCVILFIIFWVL